MVHALTPRVEPAGPLAGLGILITRPARQAGGFAQKVAVLGGTPVIFPAIVILPPCRSARRWHARMRRCRSTTSRSSFPPTPSSTARPIRGNGPRAGRLRAGSGNRGSAGRRRHRRRAHSGDDVRQRRPARAAGALRRAWQARPDLSRRRRSRASGRDAPRARRRSSTTSRATAGRNPRAARPGSPKHFAKAGVHAVTITSSEGLDNLWALADDATRTRWRACPTFVPHPRIAAHARDLGLAVVETAGGDAGLIAGLLEWAAAQTRTKS